MADFSLFGPGCCCDDEEDPGYPCAGGGAAKTFNISMSAASCGYYDYEWTGFQMPMPSGGSYAFSATVSGGTGDLAGMNGTYTSTATTSATSGCISGANLGWNLASGPCGGAMSCTGGLNFLDCAGADPADTCDGIGATSGSIVLAPGTGSAQVTVSVSWCDGVDAYRCSFIWVYECGTGWVVLSGPTGQFCKDGGAYTFTGTHPTVSVSVPGSSFARSPGRLVSSSAQDTFRQQVLDFLCCGGSFSPSTLTLKIFNGSTNVEIGSANLPGPWTGSYVHPNVTITTTASVSHAHGMKAALYWDTLELHTKQSYSCFTGLPDPVPAGTALDMQVPGFSFTGGVPSTYSQGVGYLVSEELLAQSSPSTAKQIVQKSGSTVTDTHADPGWTHINDSGTHYAQSSSDLLITDVSGTAMYLETTSGVGIVALGSTGGVATDSGCYPAFPAENIQWRT